MGDWVQIGGPWGLHGVDLSRHLLPLGHSSAGATRSVPSPRQYPSASRSHDAPTIPASDGSGPASNGGSPASNGGSLHTSYHSESPKGRGRMTPSRVPTTKKGHRCRRCPRRCLGYGGCQRLLRPEWQSSI